MKVKKSDLRALITALLKIIHMKCLDCSAYSFNELKLCVSHDCVLYPYRMANLNWLLNFKGEILIANATHAFGSKTP